MRVCEIVSIALLCMSCGPKAVQTASTPDLAETTPVVTPAEAAGPEGHPLTGKIWRQQTQAFVSQDELLSTLREAEYVFVGEKHDHPAHHVVQGALIAALQPSHVVFEMLDDQDVFGEATTPAELAEAVAWEQSGWPDFELYAPVFEAVFAVGATPVAGHPTAALVKQTMAAGAVESVAGGEGLALDRAPVGELLDDLKQEIVDAHCGYADDHLTQMMVAAQVLKDAWMARAMERAGPGAVLVAGNGHTRPDRGVPSYLDGTTAVVSLRQVQDGHEDPAHYVEGNADFVWFTASLDEPDPCEAFREQLERMGDSSSHGGSGE